MFLDRTGLRCERNAALKNKNKRIPNEINLKQKHRSLIYKWMGWACARGAWGGGGLRVCMMMGWYNRKISEGGRDEGRGGGFSTCSLWSRAGGPCFGGVVLWCRGRLRPGGTAAPCPPRWRSARTRPSGWVADCRGRPERWGPRARTRTCKHNAPPPPERGEKKETQRRNETLFHFCFFKLRLKLHKRNCSKKRRKRLHILQIK